jgi:predicted aspartyl protease
MLILSVMLNDSVQANLDFDTGGRLDLDSTFCTQNKIDLGKYNKMILSRVAWVKDIHEERYYTSPLRVKIGNTPLIYNKYMQGEYKSIVDGDADGQINFPEDDSTHVWELNFEKGYIQIYSDSLFKVSSGTSFFPMEIHNGRYFVTMPISIVFPDGNKIKRKWRCLIDTGICWDIALIDNAPEVNILNQQKDAVWTYDFSGYNRRYNSTATVFDKFKIDSLRLYTFSYKVEALAKYILGTNFLKHFNLFFDLKNKRLGLQPVNNYQRILRPLACRYHFRIETNKNGKNIITHIGDYEKNYIKKAGLKVGDEIISIDGIDYNKITVSEGDRIMKMDTVKYQIRRQGRIKGIIVHTDKSEKQGD